MIDAQVMLKPTAEELEHEEAYLGYLGIQTLADVRDILQRRDEAGSPERKLQISAINTLARVCGCAPDDLPSDPVELRPRLAQISPAMAGLTRGSWASVRSRILRALQVAGVEVMSGRRTTPLSEAWAPFYSSLPKSGWEAAVTRFVAYLSDNGVAPHEVNDAWIERFAQCLHRSALGGRLNLVVRAAVRGWNTAVDRVPGWPQQRLTLPSKQRTGYVLPVNKFSASFQKSLVEYLAFLANPPDDEDAPPKGLRPITVRLREFQVRQMASALVHRGVPIEDITSVTALVAPKNIDIICEFFINRSGRQNCSQLQGFLILLGSLAKYHLRDRQLAELINRRRRRLAGGRARRVGMTEKNRRRIAVFRDPRLVRDLLLLPYKFLKRAETQPLGPMEAARLVRAAVAIELEIMCPIRLQNLTELDADKDFVRGKSGKRAVVHLFIPGQRTKNGEDIELELPKQTMALIDLYLAKYRNLLIDPEHRGKGPRYLFPKTNGEAKVGRVFASGLCDVLERELGIAFNVHLFRHLGCFLYLRSHPGQLDVMRRVLGHRDLETTNRFYADIEQSDAFRLFDKHILEIREESIRPGRARAGSRHGGGRR